MLLGQQVRGSADPWRQILDLLALDCSRDELLGALSAAAEAQGGRALILIDALNEGEGPALWPGHLAAMLDDLRHWPRIGIVVSCRRSNDRSGEDATEQRVDAGVRCLCLNVGEH